MKGWLESMRTREDLEMGRVSYFVATAMAIFGAGVFTAGIAWVEMIQELRARPKLPKMKARK